MRGYNMTENNDSRQAAILAHLPQVRMVARKIHERLPEHISLDDLISTGTIGLISAIDHFDPSFQVQLNTYAEHKIRGAILDSLRDLDWAPRARRKEAKQIEDAIRKLQQRLRREPSEEEIAEELGLTIEEYQRRIYDIRGLDLEDLEFVSGQQNFNLLQFISDDEETLPSRQFERSELEAVVTEAIEKMPKLEKTVLSLYYREELNLREIAAVMHIHLSRVSQLKSQAVMRMRAYLRRRLFVQTANPGSGARDLRAAS